jgi:hypothetical protein
MDVYMLDGLDLVWIPWTEKTPKPYRGTPAPIASAADEAAVCLFAGAARGAVILARSVIEAVARDQGITQGKLFHKIEEMHARGLIRKDVRDAAHELRDFGNQMAHGDFSEPVSRNDAVLVLVLMEDVLEEVYGSRTRVDRHRRDFRLARGLITDDPSDGPVRAT